MKKMISMTIAAVAMMMALTGCGGATFAKGGMSTLKGNETVGVLIPEYRIMASGAMNNVHINEKLDAQAAKMMGNQIKDELTAKGYAVKVIPVDGATAELVKKYLALPRNFRHVVSDIKGADFGNLKAIFKEHGIDQLILLEGESVLQPSAAASFKSAAIGAGISLATGSIVGNFGPRPLTFTYTSSVSPDGRFTFYNREQFTKHGNLLNASERKAMAEHAVDGWLASQK